MNKIKIKIIINLLNFCLGFILCIDIFYLQLGNLKFEIVLLTLIITTSFLVLCIKIEPNVPIQDLQNIRIIPKNYVKEYFDKINITEEITTEECCICYEKYQVKDKVVKIKNCIHYFHKECIKKSILVGNEKCPYCRSIIYMGL